MHPESSRRTFLTNAGGLAAGTILSASALASVHRSDDETINVALIGCGGRGGGAAVNALSVKRGPMKLVAMSDVFVDKVESSYAALAGAKLPGAVDAPPERRFSGMESYKQAMDCLRPGDIVILATPPAFRPVHFKYAIEKGLNVFMEKPVCVDGPSGRRMLELAKEAEKKGLKVAVGLMGRHSTGFKELAKRVQDGEMGEIVAQYGYRMQGPVAKFRSTRTPAGLSEVEYQIQRFHSFLWASGGAYNDFFIHIIDHLCWMKGAWPVLAQGNGGRNWRTGPDGQRYIDQNFDSYAVEYTYPDGTKMVFEGRNMDGCENRFSSMMVGTKASAIVSASGDYGAPSQICTSRDFSPGSKVWESTIPASEANPYQNEWESYIDAVRDDKPYNEAPRGIESSLVCCMGRMAAHTGQPITFDEMLACEHDFAPGIATLTLDGTAPVMPDANGDYPVPQPGVLIGREY